MSDRTTQRDRVLELLRSKQWVTLPEILNLRIANYRARISEARKLGYQIECIGETVNGVRHTKYRLTSKWQPAIFRHAHNQPSENARAFWTDVDDDINDAPSGIKIEVRPINAGPRILAYYRSIGCDCLRFFEVRGNVVCEHEILAD